jgi:hypothetical protein
MSAGQPAADAACTSDAQPPDQRLHRTLGRAVALLLLKGGRDGLLLLVKLCYNAVRLTVDGLGALAALLARHHARLSTLPGRAVRVARAVLVAASSQPLLRKLGTLLSYLISLNVSLAANDDLDDAARLSLRCSSCLSLLFSSIRCGPAGRRMGVDAPVAPQQAACLPGSRTLPRGDPGRPADQAQPWACSAAGGKLLPFLRARAPAG